MLLNCMGIAMAFGVKEVLTGVDFTLEEGEKVALVGPNGAGKTTLFKILTGEYEATGGSIAMKRDIRIGYLSQMTELDPDRTILEECTSVFAPYLEMETECRRLEHEMAHLTGDELERVMNQYAKLTHEFETGAGYGYESRVKSVVRGLGFSDEEANAKTSRFSGGQKTRIALGKLLLQELDLLLLDEPTNHLDMPSIEWLEDVFIKNYKGAVIIISHDRYFLNKTVTKVIEIEFGKSKSYNGNYETYALQKEVDREIEIKHYLNQQAEIKRQEEVIRLLRSFNREKSIKRAESREKMLAKVERLDKPREQSDPMRLVLVPQVESGNDVLMLSEVKKSFGDFVLFKDVNFTIRKGDIVALIGANGVGKTTLINMIMNAARSRVSVGVSGLIRLGTNVITGYFDQEYTELNENNTVFDEIKNTYPLMKPGAIRNALALFSFTGDDVFKVIAMLSGGEKGRLSLCKLMLSKANFLLLDEPTNHLDMMSKEILERALEGYAGTIFYISHDRYFINHTAEKVIELTPDGATLYHGNYDYYLEKKAENEAEEKLEKPAEIKIAREQTKRTKNDAKKQAAALAKLEKEAQALENDIAALSTRLESEAASDHVLALEIYNEREEKEMRLLELYAQIEDASNYSNSMF